ncbi:hypothetical protein [Nonomuraea sp. NPDC046570]|uniref:hypothetical protein n=1 Tax=Nonomuraea sp. NPDC046570 TaxID=3155255 RepID=UPI0033EA54B3
MEVTIVISMNLSTTRVAFACPDVAVVIRLADGPAKLRQEQFAPSQKSAYFGAFGFHASAAAAPTQQITNGGLRGPHPWRDEPVIT